MDIPVLRELAEVAVEARSHEEFRRSSLDRVCRALSMDAGAMNHTTTGATISCETRGLSRERLRPSLVSYMNEFTADEYERGMRGRAFVDAQVLSRRRRESLRLYTEYLVPGGIFGFCFSMWVNRHGCFWMTLSREGRCARYSARDLRAFDALLPMLAIGEALHVQKPGEPRLRVEERWAWAREKRVTRAEYQVVELVERGLTNAAIATVLGRSINTVRNQLATVFQKFSVSNRAELVFVLGNAEIGAANDVSTEDTYLERMLRKA